jgi:hypothetical protein
MKTEYGIRGKSGYALGFALAAGFALTATLVVRAQPAAADALGRVCPLGDVCPPLCTPSITCGPIDESTVVGSFLKQKPNLACVYQCSGEQTCTEQHEDCSVSTFPLPHDYRRRVFYPAGGCPLDDATATWVCVNGLAEE